MSSDFVVTNLCGYNVTSIDLAQLTELVANRCEKSEGGWIFPMNLDLLSRGLIRHLSQDVSIELMQRHGNVVVVMGRDVVRNPPEGATVHRRFTNVWEAEGGSWRMIARHAQVVASR